MGTVQSFSALGRIIGPIIGGGLYQIMNQLPFAISGSIMMVSMLWLTGLFKKNISLKLIYSALFTTK